MIPKGKLVLVEWEDIQSSGDWNEEPESPDTASLQMVGFIAENVDKRFRKLGLCTNRDTLEETLHDRTDFPTGCITSIRELILGPELWDTGKKDNDE